MDTSMYSNTNEQTIRLAADHVDVDYFIRNSNSFVHTEAIEAPAKENKINTKINTSNVFVVKVW